MNTILETYPSFATDDTLRFKSCGNYIVVMKLSPWTLNNESRKVRNKKYASYRCVEVETIKIFNKFYPLMCIESIQNTHLNKPDCKKVTYEVGKRTTMDKPETFDKNVNNVITAGLHYFLDVHRAFYFDLPVSNYTGRYVNYDEDGRVLEEGEYVDGKMIGNWNKYWEHIRDFTAKDVMTYNNGILENITSYSSNNDGSDERLTRTRKYNNDGSYTMTKYERDGSYITTKYAKNGTPI